MKKLSGLILGLLILVGCSDTEPEPAPTPPPAQQAAPAVPTARPTPSAPVPALPPTSFAPSSATPTTGTEQPKSLTPAATTASETGGDLDLTQLWSYGLISIRTGEPLIREDGEHKLDPSLVSYGNNLVTDEHGNVLTPRGVPLEGGERLIATDEYQDDHNTREYARIYTIMAPIRDTILYHFEETTKDEWLKLTEVLTLNNIKTEDAPVVDGRAILSTPQVYDYIAGGNAEGSPIARYLEEAGLELKCLAFKDFNFTNPEGANHCEDHHFDVGSGIKLP